jgi:hypothetical protein
VTHQGYIAGSLGLQALCDHPGVSKQSGDQPTTEANRISQMVFVTIENLNCNEFV